MDDVSPLKQFSRIAALLNSLLNASSLDELETVAQKKVEIIRRNIGIAWKLLRDYESEEDLRMQTKLLPQGVERLTLIRDTILEASQYDIFGAVDVAQLSAMLDELIERLQ